MNEALEWSCIKSLAAAHTVVCLPPLSISRTPVTVSTLTGPQLPFHAGCQSRFPYCPEALNLSILGQNTSVCPTCIKTMPLVYRQAVTSLGIRHPLCFSFSFSLRPCLSISFSGEQRKRSVRILVSNVRVVFQSGSCGILHAVEGRCCGDLCTILVRCY